MEELFRFSFHAGADAAINLRYKVLRTCRNTQRSSKSAKYVLTNSNQRPGAARYALFCCMPNSRRELAVKYTAVRMRPTSSTSIHTAFVVSELQRYYLVRPFAAPDNRNRSRAQGRDIHSQASATLPHVAPPIWLFQNVSSFKSCETMPVPVHRTMSM